MKTVSLFIVLAFTETIWQAVPDFHLNIEEMVAKGNKVAA